MVKKIPPADLERVLGKDGVQSLYEVAKLVEKPEGLAEMQSMIGQIASHGYITKIVKSPIEARNLVARYLATSPKVSNMAIHALKFGTAPKVYGPIIGNAIAQGEQPQSDQGNQHAVSSSAASSKRRAVTKSPLARKDSAKAR